MSRSAEELLEFDRLKDIVGRSTTCAPGRRAIEALGFRDRTLLRSTPNSSWCVKPWPGCAMARELGFGSLADPRRVARTARHARLGACARRTCSTSPRWRKTQHACARRSRPKPRNFRVWPNAPRRWPISARSSQRFAAPSCPAAKSATTLRRSSSAFAPA